MSRIALALTLVSLAFISIAQKKPIKQVEISAETIAQTTSEKPYIIDLTRAATVYMIAEGIDLSRLRVRTSKGEEPLDDIAQRAGRSGKLVIGQGKDIKFQDLHMTSAARTASYACGGAICTCTGVADCVALSLSDKCGGIWVCNTFGCSCSIKRQSHH